MHRDYLFVASTILGRGNQSSLSFQLQTVASDQASIAAGMCSFTTKLYILLQLFLSDSLTLFPLCLILPFDWPNMLKQNERSVHVFMFSCWVVHVSGELRKVISYSGTESEENVDVAKQRRFHLFLCKSRCTKIFFFRINRHYLASCQDTVTCLSKNKLNREKLLATQAEFFTGLKE